MPKQRDWWCRLYSEVVDDDKLTWVAETTSQRRVVVLGVWTGLLALANRSPERGLLLLAENVPYTVPMLARKLDIEADVLQAVMLAMATCGLIAGMESELVTPEGKVQGDLWEVRNFQKRNPASDDATTRQQERRGGAPEEGEDVTTLSQRCHKDVTTLSQLCHGDVTPDYISPSYSDSGSDSPEGGQKGPDPPPKAARPPSADVYHEVARLWPDRATWPALQPVVDLQRWRAVVTAYIAAGWNKRNVAGMLEYYERGEVPRTGRKKKGDGEMVDLAAAEKSGAYAQRCEAPRPGKVRDSCLLSPGHEGPHQGASGTWGG